MSLFGIGQLRFQVNEVLVFGVDTPNIGVYCFELSKKFFSAEN
jgi:hypothetical protein